MGVSVEVAGVTYEVVDYDVQMESTPLTLDDTAQSTGSFSVTLHVPETRDPFLPSYDRRVINPIFNPKLDSTRVSYNPADYTVQDIEIEGRKGVRITALGVYPGRGFFTLSGVGPFSSPVLPDRGWSSFPNAVSASFYLLARYGGGANSLQFESHTPIGGRPGGLPVDSAVVGPSTPGVFTTIQARGYLNLRGEVKPQPDAAPFPNLRLPSSAGGYIDLFEVSTERPVVDGDAPPSIPSVGTEDRFEWAGPHADSPSIQERFSWTPKVTAPPYRVRRNLVSGLGDLLFQGASVKLTDSELGTLEGEVARVSISEGGQVTIDCDTRLHVFNAYRVSFRPSDATIYESYSGTLREAVDYYTSKTKGASIWVDPEVANRRVSFQGWSGELWVHLKQLATVSDCELSVIGGLPVLRPVRRRTLTPGRMVQRQVSAQSPALAQAVTVTAPGATPIRGGSVPCSYLETTVLSAAPGTSETFSIPVDATLSEVHVESFEFSNEEGQRVFESRVSLKVELDEDDSSLVNVTIAPSPALKTSNVYLAPRTSDSSSRVNSLKLSGVGLALNPRTVPLPTGVDPTYATEVGASLESPFIQNEEEAVRMGVRSLPNYSLPRLVLSGTVDRSLPWGITGAIGEVTYRLSEPELERLTGDTDPLYSSVQDFTDDPPQTYSALRETLRKSSDTWGTPQEFGSVAGSRVWDIPSNRWYRIRSARITRAGISFEAEDDLTIGEAVKPWQDAGLTYGQADASLPGVHPLNPLTQPTYKELYLAGVVDA